jgi:uncharacterized repeat protein (TIGR03803 family)
MQSNDGKRSRALWARGFAALWAALIVAAGGGALAAPVETVLYSFKGGSDGNEPFAGLIADSSGNLYGTTAFGGASNSGVVFKLSPSGTETALYSFTNGSDGGSPFAGLIADSSGNLYGTTTSGGASNRGVVFKLSPGGAETVLHSFCSLPGCSDGNDPFAGLIADSSGNLYGTTLGGGASNAGVVFKLSPGGTETVLYSFTGGSDGAFPQAGLIADSSGNLYGTTSAGGASGGCGEPGCGTVFKLSPSGTETVLYAFKGFPSDGQGPAGLIADSNGNLYGTTQVGGTRVVFCPSGCGTVFKLSPGGTETVLYAFSSFGDGAHPYAGLIADSSGNLYGTTYDGSAPCSEAAGCGVVFKLSPDGTETVLYSFTGGSDGGSPFAGLIADSSGNLYGTTAVGGASGCNVGLGCGVVFKLTGTGFVPAIPFAAFKAALAIDFGTSPNPGGFELQSEFTLGQSSNGINPAAEPVTLQIGTFTATIPAGSFTGTGFGPFTFGGVVDGGPLQVLIEPTGTKRYAMKAEAGHPNLTGTVNPVTVMLTIGTDTGTTSVTATIASGVATAH